MRPEERLGGRRHPANLTLAVGCRIILVHLNGGSRLHAVLETDIL